MKTTKVYYCHEKYLNTNNFDIYIQEFVDTIDDVIFEELEQDMPDVLREICKGHHNKITFDMKTNSLFIIVENNEFRKLKIERYFGRE